MADGRGIVTEDCAESGRGSEATTVVRVGAIAVEPARGDREANVALAERLVAEAAGRGAELVVLPEGFLEGYVVNEPEMTRERFLALAEPLDGPYVARFRALARRHGVWLLACFAEREGPAAYNTALLLAADGAIAGRYRKTHVQSGGDWRFYAPGEALPVFATPWGPTGVMICYDRQFPEVPRALARQGARLLLNPSWGMFNDLNEAMMRTRAHENGVYIVFAHVRGALVLDPRGAVAARSDPEATVLVHEVDLAAVDAVRRSPRGHLIDHLRPDLYASAGRGERRERDEMTTPAAQQVDEAGPPARPLKIHVITDLEGAAMVFRFEQTRTPEPTPLKREAMRLLTGEVNACVDGILDVDGEADVLVWDGHGNGGIVYERFHDRARLLPHRHTPAPYGLDETFDAVFFVGQHAMAGTEAAPLAHTYSSLTVEHYTLNGHPIGEFGMRAYMAGTLFGVPVAFLSGDDKAVAEAQGLVPELVGVATKTGTGLESAVSLGPGRARELIRQGARRAARNAAAGTLRPVRLDPPYVWEIRVREGQEGALTRYLERDGATRVDGRTVVIRTDDPRAVLR